jgi:fructokinase
MIRIGVDLGGTKTEIIALDEAGKELVRRRVRTPTHDYEEIIDQITSLVIRLEDDIGRKGTVGIGTPGALSRATGLLKNSNSVCLNGRPILADLEGRLQRTIRISNDANCFALSEAIDGAGAGASVVFGVIVGTGTGGGIVVNGSVLTGPNGIAGEWGHNPLPWPRDDERPGPPCYCGRYGCIETFLSGPGMARDHEAANGMGLAPRAIVDGARSGDKACAETLQRYADRMARSLAHVINILDPDVIVLGGGMSNIEELYTRVPSLWVPYVFSDRVDTKLCKAVHGDSSGVRGAAWLWPVTSIPRSGAV